MTQMEKYTMILDWKNQYCQNNYTTQGSLETQCNPCEITKGAFADLGKNLKIFSVYECIPESLSCTPETDTTLSIFKK